MSRYVQALVSFFVCMAASGALHAETYLVENTDDSGAGTLRAAIASANTNPGADTIEFDAGVTGTIVLASPLPQLADDVTITGPGAELVTVSGNSLVQPFSILSGSAVTLSGLTIANGRSVGLFGFGGGISNEGDLTVTDCVLANNHAELEGGAIANFGGSLVVSQSLLSGNTTDVDGVGAGISNVGDDNVTGTVLIIESTVTGNSAGFGGAVSNLDTMTIVRSTLSSNDAVYGGAIDNTGTLTVRNSTLSGNVANTSGGAIDNFTGGEAIVEFSTLTNNAAASGGGIENNASITFKNSLVVNSIGAGDCFSAVGGTFTALDTNFATDASCPGFVPSTESEINLGALADNGGPTLTHALLGDSAAIDVALDCTLSDGFTGVTQDQRGQARPIGAECDSGAFEVSASPPQIIFQDGFESQ
jgi:hypothetical protein